eukprot:CAMPEP_0171460892 /NCGR_PEP_ID=MMETSP0945-20130129/5578_1 /TAXON_ID=109269 /ORGANISM="Vaucheria litorea, Strain CCMP2940" /LENGTH=210 /DNA_ID=CAMNT_0011987169 /DNA_START=57 /DNA_END=689 /DNA_ORIENTATION=+
MKFSGLIAAFNLLACANGFMSGPSVTRASRKCGSSSGRSSLTMQSDMSKSIPFVSRPPMLTGEMPGDVGFDPLELSNNIDLGYAQAAELKHGRVAMMAVVGVFVTQFVHLPAEQFNTSNLIEAVSKVPLAGHLQIFGFIALFELSSLNKVYNDDMDAWNRLVTDPNGAKKYASMSAQEKAKAQLQEIKNGRLAMMAVMGMIVQTAIFGHI